MKRIITIFTFLVILFNTTSRIYAKADINYEAEIGASYEMVNIELGAEIKGAYLIEAKTGKVLYAQGEFDKASIASVTKIMTLLLVCEALDEGRINLDDTVTVSANAASMGGSQVYLEEGERISVEDLIKSTVVASGNDASVALAEYCAGSEAEFVRQMNQKAIELGLKNTHFENTTGLDDTDQNHYSCAADVGKMSRELIKYDIILKYSSIWQDSIRNGAFTLTNTNRLVRYYDGCNGLKTGSTDKAGYCISATAKRGNMQLIAVVLGAETRDKRNEAARTLLDYGFANFALYEKGAEFIEKCDVNRGVVLDVNLYSNEFSCVVSKNKYKSVELEYMIPETIDAPIDSKQIVGSIIFKVDGVQIGKSDIYCEEWVEKISIAIILKNILKRIIIGQFSS